MILWGWQSVSDYIEQWKDIEGYEGLYQVSNLGNVKSLNRTSIKEGRDYRVKEKILKTFLCSSGYPTVVLSNNGKKETLMVHRLVALHFIPNPHKYEQINHKDENKNNNNVDNLEWCTQDYNLHYGNRGKKISEARRRKNKEEGGIE